MATLAKVKSVTSGDSLVLKSPKSGAEKTVSLAYISAPRLKRDGDEVSCSHKTNRFCAAFALVLVVKAT